MLQNLHLRCLTEFHCMKSVQIRSFFCSVFSCIPTEYGDLLRKSSYSVQVQENTNQKKLRILILFTQCSEYALGQILEICTAQNKVFFLGIYVINTSESFSFCKNSLPQILRILFVFFFCNISRNQEIKYTCCVKILQIWSFFWSVFSRVQTEYGDLWNKYPYSVQIRENKDQKKLRIWKLFTQ